MGHSPLLLPILAALPSCPFWLHCLAAHSGWAA